MNPRPQLQREETDNQKGKIVRVLLIVEGLIILNNNEQTRNH